VPGYLANPLSLLVRNYRAVDWPQLWIEAPMATCVACCDELVIGSYMIQANQPGLEIVGTLPKAFRHRQLGYVDAHVMSKKLPPGGAS
jgi:hypothetical protein